MAERHLELGLFAPTVGSMPPAGKPGAFLLSHAEQRTEPTFDYNLHLARMLDRAGLELFFMAQRGGKGFGPSRFWGTSLDSFTTASALAMTTERLQLVSTVHTAFFHPGLVARIGATLDQISHGRWRLNIVSGWAENDFRMLDIPLIEHDARYRRSAEFVEVLGKFWTEDWFDYAGEYYTIRQGTCAPKPASPPLLYNAGSSAAGREFAARYCDWFFTAALTPEAVKEEIADVQARAATYGRRLRIVTYALTMCRETEAAAEQEMEDILAQGDYDGAREFLEGISGQTLGTTKSVLGEGGELDDMLKSLVLGIGSSKLIGPPEKVAHDLARLHEAGVDAVGLTFRHTEEELADFIQRVVPLLEQHGVRRPRQAPRAQVAD